jgi:hypothetical protein
LIFTLAQISRLKWFKIRFPGKFKRIIWKRVKSDRLTTIWFGTYVKVQKMLGVIRGLKNKEKNFALKSYLLFLSWNQFLSHVERMQNQRFPKQIALATMVGTWKGGKALTTRRSEAVEELIIIGVKKQAGNDQRLLGMEEDCPERTVMPEKRENQINRLGLS